MIETEETEVGELGADKEGGSPSLCALPASSRRGLPGRLARTAGRIRWVGSPDFVEVTRVDHWFKNVFVLVGWIAGLLFFDAALSPSVLLGALLALFAACFVSTINYIVNAIADAPFDAHHPAKRMRALPAGRVSRAQLNVWSVFFLAGVVACSLALPWRSVVALLALLAAGLVYNIPPARAKDIPYVDVVSESVNNPIRILIGWYSLQAASSSPPVSLLALTWAFGAYLMTGKRFAELRSLQSLAAAYRPTFARYSSRSLGVAMLAYAVLAIALYVIVALDYRVQLLYALPLIAFFLVWLTRIAFEEDSMVKDPEKLFRKPLFFVYSLVTFALIVALAVV
ncbi:MAG: UbiA family prenyltransferase [Planctomycetota bacterium]